MTVVKLNGKQIDLYWSWTWWLDIIMKDTLGTCEWWLVTLHWEALYWYPDPGPEVLMQFKHCPLEICGRFAQLKVDGIVPKLSTGELMGEGHPWLSGSQGHPARSGLLVRVTWALMLLTTIVGSHCSEKLQGHLWRGIIFGIWRFLCFGTKRQTTNV